MAFIGMRRKKKKEGGNTATESILSKKRRKKKKSQAHILCIQNHLAHMDEMWNDVLEFPDDGKLDTMVIRVCPDEGLWKGYLYKFTLKFNDKFPIKEPAITIAPRIWHPNINSDEEGIVCLLRDKWNPTMNLDTIFWAVKMLLIEPNADDPLNIPGAEDYDRDYPKFKKQALEWMRKYGKKE